MCVSVCVCVSHRVYVLHQYLVCSAVHINRKSHEQSPAKRNKKSFLRSHLCLAQIHTHGSLNITFSTVFDGEFAIVVDVVVVVSFVEKAVVWPKFSEANLCHCIKLV